MKIKITAFLMISLITLSSITYAQDSKYQTKVVDGIEYYVYQVETSEGLYSISKKFGVTQSDINNANPQIHDGIKAGQEILIPKSGKLKHITSQTTEEDEFILHTVEKKQTLFAISRKYNVSQEAITEANPQLQNGLKTGDVLRIPVKIKNKKNEQNITKEPIKETTIKEITPVKTVRKQNENEKLKDKTVVTTIPPKLHIGSEETYIVHRVETKETLYSISKKYNVEVEDITRLNPGVETSLKTGAELRIPYKKSSGSSVAAVNTVVAKPLVEKTSYKIAYLLPYMLDSEKQDPTVEKFIEFYLGSLLAVNNAKNGNFKIDVYTFDTEKSELQINEILNKPEMQKMDLIIGPAYTAQIPVLTDFSNRRKINTLIPFSSNIKNIDTNPYIFQFNPDNDVHNDFAVDAFKNKFRDVIFDTENLTSVQPYLNNLYELTSKYDVGVLGQYSWRGKSGRKPKMYYIAPFNPNSTTNDVIQYENDYKQYYGQMRSDKNPRFDMLGYDITNFFLKQMGTYGFRFNEKTNSLKYNEGIQSDFNFKRTGNGGGFINQQLFLIEDASKRK
ncbi:MAG: Peptidoglycan-binding lysin domain [Bacteroidetes bacterium]|nr:Peptidoglycan-binding lysin domain [Bacteroidota bacterium]